MPSGDVSTMPRYSPVRSMTPPAHTIGPGRRSRGGTVGSRLAGHPVAAVVVLEPQRALVGGPRAVLAGVVDGVPDPPAGRVGRGELPHRGRADRAPEALLALAPATRGPERRGQHRPGGALGGGEGGQVVLDEAAPAARGGRLRRRAGLPRAVPGGGPAGRARPRRRRSAGGRALRGARVVSAARAEHSPRDEAHGEQDAEPE